VLHRVRGFVFDCDGCVWNGDALNPGAGETLSALHGAGRSVAFLTNNSGVAIADLVAKLRRLGVAFPASVLSPLEIIGEVIAQRFGISRVLVLGTAELRGAVARAGHATVEVEAWRDATVVVVGRDPAFTYERMTAASRAVAAGAALMTPNLDPRMPLERDEFVPGCGAVVEAVAVAAGVRPIVIGKPETPLFRIALERLGLPAAQVAMVGDSLEADVAGGRAVGMRTVLYAPDGAPSGAADVVVRSFVELARLAGI
jgi:4-nitrophenyl phosphatase